MRIEYGLRTIKCYKIQKMMQTTDNSSVFIDFSNHDESTIFSWRGYSNEPITYFGHSRAESVR